MEPLRIAVTTPSRTYVITLGDGVRDRVTRILDDAGAPARRFVVSSPLVWRFHGQRFATAMSAEAIIDPSLLGTLPRREFRAGLYEVIKYGMTSSAALFERLGRERKQIFARHPETLAAIIAESCRIKAEVVAADEKEAGLRRILNFGHTAGHALEAVTKYRRYRHGEAVAYGMLVAANLAVARGVLAERDRQALADLVASLGPLPPISDLSAAEILDAMQHDKEVV